MNVLPSSRRFTVVAFAAVLVLSGCHKKVVPAPPAAPPPPPPPVPTATISISPQVIESGQSATLSWSTANADKVTISGVGPVETNGTRSVAPMRSTDYTVTATASNGAKAESSVHLTVNARVIPPAPAPAPTMTEEELFAQNVHDVFFDYDKYSLRPADAAIATQDAAFLKSHASMKVVVEGNCDDRGSEEYNLALGESRAESLKKALIAEGVDASRIKVVSFGEEKPVCHEENESCWQQNRHDHVRLDYPAQ